VIDIAIAAVEIATTRDLYEYGIDMHGGQMPSGYAD
jgi:hypothetical protein